MASRSVVIWLFRIFLSTLSLSFPLNRTNTWLVGRSKSSKSSISIIYKAFYASGLKVQNQTDPYQLFLVGLLSPVQLETFLSTLSFVILFHPIINWTQQQRYKKGTHHEGGEPEAERGDQQTIIGQEACLWEQSLLLGHPTIYSPGQSPLWNLGRNQWTLSKLGPVVRMPFSLNGG